MNESEAYFQVQSNKKFKVVNIFGVLYSFKQTFAEISQSQRMPLLGPSPTSLLELFHIEDTMLNKVLTHGRCEIGVST